MTRVLISLLLGLCAVAALADEALDPKVVAEAMRQLQQPAEKVRELALHGCDSAATADRRGCTQYWLISSDLAMSDLLRQLVADRSGRPQQKLLQESQRAWLAFRDAACQFEVSGYASGPQASLESLQCLKTATDTRNAQLQGYASCTAGAACP
ncbi:MAG: lysozyme inhibitor LprI family protein [Betaproteobacteria bacterium]